MRDKFINDRYRLHRKFFQHMEAAFLRKRQIDNTKYKSRGLWDHQTAKVAPPGYSLVKGGHQRINSSTSNSQFYEVPRKDYE